MFVMPFHIETVKKQGLPLGVISLIALNIWMQDVQVFIHTFPQLFGGPAYVEDYLTFMSYKSIHPFSPGLLMSIFTHGGWWHLFGNMLFLWVFGWVLEDRLGTPKFLLLYLFSGLLGEGMEAAFIWAIHWIQHSEVFEYQAIGASGAVAGVMGAATLRFWNLKVRVLNPLVFFFIFWFLLPLLFPFYFNNFWMIPFVLLFGVPFGYLVGYFPHSWSFRWPLWVFTLLFFAGEYLDVVFGVWDGTNHMAHAFCFMMGAGMGYLLYLPQENLEELRLGDAREHRDRSRWEAAAGSFTDYLKKRPEDTPVYLELAEVYERLHQKSRYKKTGFKRMAHLNFQKAMEGYMNTARGLEALKIYRKLRGDYPDSEFRPEVLDRLQRLGLSNPALSLENEKRRRGLEAEIKELAGQGRYHDAHPPLEEWWKLGTPDDTDPAFLGLALQMFHRFKEGRKVESGAEQLAATGDLAQATQALWFLAGEWLGTPKQLRLRVAFRRALVRFPDLKLNRELMEKTAGLELAGVDLDAKQEHEERLVNLEWDIRALAEKGHFREALPKLAQWWALTPYQEADLGFLTAALDLFDQAGEGNQAEQLAFHLAQHGDERQAARGLWALKKYWMGTPRQVRLAETFKRALERLPDLRLNRELMDSVKGLGLEGADAEARESHLSRREGLEQSIRQVAESGVPAQAVDDLEAWWALGRY